MHQTRIHKYSWWSTLGNFSVAHIFITAVQLIADASSLYANEWLTMLHNQLSKVSFGGMIVIMRTHKLVSLLKKMTVCSGRLIIISSCSSSHSSKLNVTSDGSIVWQRKREGLTDSNALGPSKQETMTDNRATGKVALSMACLLCLYCVQPPGEAHTEIM